MLDEALAYLEKRSQVDATFQYEVIVVSDGSKDLTVELALKYTKKYTAEKVRVLNLIKNRGKGGAVRLVSVCIMNVLILIFLILIENYFTFAGNVECTRPTVVVCRC